MYIFHLFALKILVTDIIWLIPTFIMAFIAASMEGRLADPLYIYGNYINTGAFAVASVNN